MENGRAWRENGRGEHREHKEWGGRTVSMLFMFYTAKISTPLQLYTAKKVLNDLTWRAGERGAENQVAATAVRNMV